MEPRFKLIPFKDIGITLKERARLEAAVLGMIEGQNWTDQPLTKEERNVASMAVGAVIALLGGGAEGT